MNTLQLILVVIFPAIVLAFINQNSATCCKLSTFSPPKRICPTIDYGFDRNSYYTHIVLNSKAEDKSDVVQGTEPSAFDRVASTGLAGVLAIAAAESIFWALGMPLAELWVYFTTGELIDLTTQEGQLQAAGFTFVCLHISTSYQFLPF